MSDYLYLYRGGDDSGSAEDMQQVMQRWVNWLQDLKAKGVLKNFGEPLQPGGKVVRNRTTITDGPYAEAKDLIGGYSIVTADSLEQAAELAEGCPVFINGGFVEVRPIMSMNM